MRLALPRQETTLGIEKIFEHRYAERVPYEVAIVLREESSDFRRKHNQWKLRCPGCDVDRSQNDGKAQRLLLRAPGSSSTLSRRTTGGAAAKSDENNAIGGHGAMGYGSCCNPVAGTMLAAEKRRAKENMR